MSHWRTTACGIAMIVGAVATLAGMLFSGMMPTADQWTMLGAAIVTGAGHLYAADGKSLPPGGQ